MFLAEVGHPTRSYYVLEHDTGSGPSIIGYCGVMVVGDTADVQTIAVLPEHEGNGYGRAMLETMHTRSRQQGAERILLEVRADNPRAQHSTGVTGTRVFTCGPATTTTALTYLRAKVINSLINVSIRLYKEKFDDILTGNLDQSLLSIFKKENKTLQDIKQFSIDEIYNHRAVVEIEKLRDRKSVV